MINLVIEVKDLETVNRKLCRAIHIVGSGAPGMNAERYQHPDVPHRGLTPPISVQNIVLSL